MAFELVLGTQNQGKIAELRQLLLGRCEVLGLGDLKEGPPPEVSEDGGTYYENALKKALAYQAFTGRAILADDSGLEVDALNGAPGVHSAYYGGASLSWPQRWDFLLAQLKRVPPTQWQARFRCVLCFYDGHSVPRFFEGVAAGRVLEKPRGTQGFGYDPIIWSEELGQSFAEASPQQKNQVSHRAKALKAFGEWLDQHLLES